MRKLIRLQEQAMKLQEKRMSGRTESFDTVPGPMLTEYWTGKGVV